MNRSSSKAESRALRMLHDLRSADNLAARLAETSPNTCKAEGGAHRLVARYAGRTGAVFWCLNLCLKGEAAIALWEAMAGEHQAAIRANAGEANSTEMSF